MKMRTIGAIIVLLALIALPAIASAAIVTFSGQDDGAPVVGPFPNSVAAQTAFTAAAGVLGSLNTITFENLAVGYYTPFTAAPGVSVSYNGTDYGSGLSGISNTTIGNLYGFNTTTGGSQWFGFPGGSATFAFTNPTQSFGMYLTGLETIATSSVTVSFNDGTSQVLSSPVNPDGGAQYFGFTDAGASIVSITINNIPSSTDYIDAWGIDDVTFNGSAAVPLPGAVLLFRCGYGPPGGLCPSA